LDDVRYDVVIEALRKVIKRMHYPLEVMLVCVQMVSFRVWSGPPA